MYHFDKRLRRLLFRYRHISPYRRPSMKHAFWPVRTDLVNIFRSFFIRFIPISKTLKEIGIYNSVNQWRALNTLEGVPLFKFWQIVTLKEKVGFSAILILSVAKAVIVCMSSSRKSIKDFPYLYLVIAYKARAKIYKSLLDRIQGKTIHFSSDHQGPIFEIFNIENSNKITRVYHQHGVRLPYWPSNDYEFKNIGGQELINEDGHSSYYKYDITLYFNSVQGPIQRLKCLKHILGQYDEIAVKFHPRKNKNFIEKIFMDKYGFNDVSDQSSINVIRSTKLNACANSGVLVECYRHDPNRTIWITSLPPFQDFYNLKGQVDEWRI